MSDYGVSTPVQEHGGYNTPGRGVKADHGKQRWHYLPFDLMDGEQRVWEKGAAKYAPMNWRRGMPMTQPLNAAMRHLASFLMGEDNDPETGESHLDHALCCIRMAENTRRYYPTLDDRVRWTPPEVPDAPACPAVAALRDVPAGASADC